MESSTCEHEPQVNLIVVLMVRGLFPCASVTGDLLFDPFWEATERPERCGLTVMASTCDGASVNRCLFKLHQTGKELVHKVVNPYATERFVYFFSDLPCPPSSSVSSAPLHATTLPPPYLMFLHLLPFCLHVSPPSPPHLPLSHQEFINS